MIFICRSSAGTLDANPRAILRECPLLAVQYFQGSALLRMPRLRHVLDPRLASVTDQNEGQSISVWAAELIHAGSSAIFWDRPCTASLLNCDRIA